jgi:hypothetical protein
MREEAIEFLTGARPWPSNETARWGLFRNPLPPSAEHSVFRDIRNDAGMPPNKVTGPRFDELGQDVRRGSTISPSNTIQSSVVSSAEHGKKRGLLKRIGVMVHPRADDGLPLALFDGQA